MRTDGSNSLPLTCLPTTGAYQQDESNFRLTESSRASRVQNSLCFGLSDDRNGQTIGICATQGVLRDRIELISIPHLDEAWCVHRLCIFRMYLGLEMMLDIQLQSEAAFRHVGDACVRKMLRDDDLLVMLCAGTIHQCSAMTVS